MKKNISRNRKFFSRYLFLLLFMGLFFAAEPAAENYPSKPIVVMVPYSAGGATDFQARTITSEAKNGDSFGQPVVILNKPGAGGRIGWDWFASRAEKDGYQLATYNIPHLIAQSIVFKTKYSIDNLEPISNWGADPAVLVVSRISGFKSLEDLIDYARTNPGRITVSGAGLYVGHHIAFLQLQKAARIKLNYIPTQGGVPALQLVMSEKVSAGFNNLSDAVRNRERLNILAIADLQRNSEFAPEIPTFLELGYDIDDSSVNFRGLMAPSGTPSSIVDFLAERSVRMFRNDDVQKRMQTSGSPMKIMTREEVQRMWRERHAYLSQLLSSLTSEHMPAK